LGVLRGYARLLRDLFRVRRHDLVYIHINVTPLGTSASERLVRALAGRIVYDLEDNVIGGHSGSARDPNKLLRLLKGSGKPRYLVRASDHVIASSPQLAERCALLNRRRASTYITSSVDTDRFVPAPPRSGERPVTIGWTGT